MHLNFMLVFLASIDLFDCKAVCSDVVMSPGCGNVIDELSVTIPCTKMAQTIEGGSLKSCFDCQMFSCLSS